MPLGCNDLWPGKQAFAAVLEHLKCMSLLYYLGASLKIIGLHGCISYDCFPGQCYELERRIQRRRHQRRRDDQDHPAEQ